MTASQRYGKPCIPDKAPSLLGCLITQVTSVEVCIETTVASIQAQNLISRFRLVQQSFSGTPLLLFSNDEAILRFFGDTLSAHHSDDEEPIWQQLFSSLNC